MAFIQILILTLNGIFDAIEDFFDAFKEDKRKGYVDEFSHSSDFISCWNKGFSINGKKSGRITAEVSRTHCCFFGPSGHGKTSRLIIPNIYLLGKKGNSQLVNDPSGEIYKLTSGYLLARGYDIKTLNLIDPTKSDYFNPLAFASNSSEISQIADLLIRHTLNSPSDQGFWNESAKSLLFVILSILKEQDTKYQNLFNAKYLLNQITPGKLSILDHLFSKTKNEILFAEYKNFLGMDAKLQLNITSTAKAALQLWNDESVVRLSSFNTVSFQSLRKGKTALYIQAPTLSASRLSPYTSLLIEQCFNELMKEIPSSDDLPIYFMLDELSTMILPSFEAVLSNGRKYNLNICFSLQHPAQLNQKYGPHNAKSILANANTKVYLPGQDLDTAQHISASLGHTDFKDPDTGHKRTMALMTPREVSKLKKDRAIVFIGNHAFKTKLRPYFKNRLMRMYSELPPFLINRQPPFEKVPLISDASEIEA